MNTLYCIECERVVVPDPCEELEHSRILSTQEPPFLDIEVCEFPKGFATCPPPEFDIEQFAETVQQEIEEDFLPFDYDPETDQIIEWVL